MGKLWERVYWFLILLAVLGFVGFKIHGFHARYKSNEFRTEIRMVDVDRYIYPELQLCSRSLLKKADPLYCYKNKSFWGSQYCHQHISVSGKEFTKDYSNAVACARVNSSDIMNAKLGTGIIQVRDRGTRIQRSTKSLQDYGIRVNLVGSLHTDRPSYNFLKFGEYRFQILSVTIINRLGFPFKSNCTNGEGDINVFPEPYTRKKCIDTRMFKKFLKKCHDVPDHWKEYVRPHHEIGWDDSYGNMTNINIYRCFYKVLSSSGLDRYIADHKDCPLPCKELIFENEMETRQEYSMNDIKSRGARSSFSIRFNSKRVTEITEVAVYTLDDFFSDLGSWLGLLVGMSLLSIVELITFIFTALVEKLRCQISLIDMSGHVGPEIN